MFFDLESVVIASRHFARRIGPAPGQLASDQALPSPKIKQAPFSLPVAAGTGSLVLLTIISGLLTF